MMTTAEAISAGLSYYSNAGSPSIRSDLRERQRAHFFLTKVCNRIDNAAPHWWKLADSSVVLSSGVGTMPSDFAHAGESMLVYISGQQFREVRYRSPGEVQARLQYTPQSGLPEFYTLHDRTSLGIPKILCWPTDSSTLILKSYVRGMPELIDAPLQLVTAEGGAGNPNGAYTYKVTNVTASGETEGGDVSVSRTVSSKIIMLTQVRTWWGRTVTSRKIYRTAASGLQHKLVDTLSDNLTTTYSDNIADGSLGANIPTPVEAITGLEYFPAAFHDSAIFDGLVYLLSRNQGDGRLIQFDAKWERSIRRLWEVTRQGQNTVEAGSPWPGRGGPQGIWSRFTRPS